MKIYKCRLNDAIMYEDELPVDLPIDIYDWWFENSYVDGVRIGPIIEEVEE